MKEAPEYVKDRIRACLVGVAIGDAMGMAWETCSHEEILELTGGKGVTGLQDIPEAWKTRRKWDTRGITLGQTTDDWQLTKAVAQSVIRRGKFDLIDQAASHVAALETSTKGWGGSTREGIGEIRRWFDTRGAEGRHPQDPVEPKEGFGLGNGVIMKIAPLVCLGGLEKRGKYIRLPASVHALGRMTHHRDAILPARLVAEVMEDSIEPREDGDPLSQDDRERWFLAPLCNYRRDDDPIDCLVRQVFRAHDSSEKHALSPMSKAILSSADKLREATGVKFLADSTAAFALGTFLRHVGDFRSAVLEAINAGGDTDTQASIVGALVGANVGMAGIPQEWIDAIPDAREALEIANQLIASVLSRD